MKKPRSVAVIGGAILFVLLLALCPASAALIPQPTVTPSEPAPANVTARQVSSGPGDKLYPAVSGRYILWYDNDSSSLQLYDMDGESVTQISGNESVPVRMPRSFDLFGNQAVWMGVNLQAGQTDIFLYNIEEGTIRQITDDPALQAWLAVAQDYIVWTEYANESDDSGSVYLFDLALDERFQVSPLSDDAEIQTLITVGGETLAWSEVNATSSIIAVYYLDTETWRTLYRTDQERESELVIQSVSSDGQRIADMVLQEGESLLVLFDSASEEFIEIPGVSGLPEADADEEALLLFVSIASVDGDLLVWADDRGGSSDIYLYDIGTGAEMPLSTDTAEQAAPDVAGEQVVWMGNDTGQWEIYLLNASDLQPPPAATPAPTPTPAPAPEPTAPPIRILPRLAGR